MATAKETRHVGLGLDAERLLDMYRQMVLARAVDRRMWVLNRQGKAPFVISGQGHEAIQVAAASAMRPGTDWLVPYYRDLAFCLALRQTARAFMPPVFGQAQHPPPDPYALRPPSTAASLPSRSPRPPATVVLFHHNLYQLIIR